MIKRNDALVNHLAMVAGKDTAAFNELYTLISPEFAVTVNDYLRMNNLSDFNFDKTDYISMAGQALWESLINYDSSKGDFMGRFNLFAKRRFKEVTDHNLAVKRFNKSKQVISYEELQETSNIDIEDENARPDTANRAVKEFIKIDKDGKVIEILISTSDTKLRSAAFTKLFGQYGATERKKVQRTRERLRKSLTESGIYV